MLRILLMSFVGSQCGHSVTQRPRVIFRKPAAQVSMVSTAHAHAHFLTNTVGPATDVTIGHHMHNTM